MKTLTEHMMVDALGFVVGLVCKTETVSRNVAAARKPAAITDEKGVTVE